MTAVAGEPVTAIGRVRFSIVAMLFAVTIVNYADRATIAIAGPVLSKDLGLSAVQMGFVFSAFGWSYVIGQIPGGWLLDRFGSKSVYFVSIFTWSLFHAAAGRRGSIRRDLGGLCAVRAAVPGWICGIAFFSCQCAHCCGLVSSQ